MRARVEKVDILGWNLSKVQVDPPQFHFFHMEWVRFPLLDFNIKLGNNITFFHNGDRHKHNNIKLLIPNKKNTYCSIPEI